MDLIPVIPAVAMISLAIVVAFTGKAILDNLDKIRWLMKGCDDGKVQNPPNKWALSTLILNLKWGFVLAGLGLALLLKELVFPFLSETGTLGLMLLCAGIAFFIYYFLAKKSLDTINNRDEDE